MKKRFSDEQIINILREAEAGVSARELCRNATFYTWRKKFGGMELPEVKRLKSLEEENEHWFHDVVHAKEIISAWRQDYNECRPHSSLNYQTPSEFAAGWRNGEYGSKSTDITN